MSNSLIRNFSRGVRSLTGVPWKRLLNWPLNARAEPTTSRRRRAIATTRESRLRCLGPAARRSTSSQSPFVSGGNSANSPSRTWTSFISAPLRELGEDSRGRHAALRRRFQLRRARFAQCAGSRDPRNNAGRARGAGVRQRGDQRRQLGTLVVRRTSVRTGRGRMHLGLTRIAPPLLA